MHLLARLFVLALSFTIAASQVELAAVMSTPEPPQCPVGKVYKECGSACPPTCGLPDLRPCFSVCVQGCFCSPGLYATGAGECVPKESCPTPSSTPSPTPSPSDPPTCPPGKEYQECGSACPRRCGQPEPLICTAQCVQGCFCCRGQYETANGECVPKESCPTSSPPPEGCLYGGKRYEDGDGFLSTDGCNRCFCAGGNVACTQKFCLPKPRAPVSRNPPTCPPGKEFRECGTACPLRCGQPEPLFCTFQCVRGCFCPRGLYEDPHGECVPKDRCPTPSPPSETTTPLLSTPTPSLSPDGCLYGGKRYEDGDRFLSTDGCNRCFCAGYVVACTKKICLPQVSRNPRNCSPGKEFRECGTACPLRCGQPESVLCTLQCVRGCFCPRGQYETANGKCVRKERCPALSPPPGGCQYEGAYYNDGDGFPAADECNTCFCNNGSVGCTEIYCPTLSTSPTPPDGCLCGGKRYEDGDHFVSADKCNICHCLKGMIACTQKFCPSDPPKCPAGKEFQKCGTACPSRCGLRDVNCTFPCVRGCFCPSNQYETADGQCVSKENCPICRYGGKYYNHGDAFPSKDIFNNTCYCLNGTVACKRKLCPAGKEFQECGSSCPLRCGQPESVLCILRCVRGCFCPRGQYETANGKCVPKERCPAPSPPPGCLYGGKRYEEGDRFPSTDGCNRCSCAGSTVSCTEKLCTGKCKTTTKREYVVVNGCRSRGRVVVKECGGSCKRPEETCKPSKKMKRQGTFICPREEGRPVKSKLSYDRVIACKCA